MAAITDLEPGQLRCGKEGAQPWAVLRRHLQWGREGGAAARSLASEFGARLSSLISDPLTQVAAAYSSPGMCATMHKHVV